MSDVVQNKKWGKNTLQFQIETKILVCQIQSPSQTYYLQGISVQNDKFKIMIMVGLKYIRKQSW